MGKKIIAFTNFQKLFAVEHEGSKLAKFFGEKRLGLSCDNEFAFIVIKEGDHEFTNTLPDDFSNVGAVICYDCYEESDQAIEYIEKVKTLFNSIKSARIIHHTHQHKELLNEIRNRSILDQFMTIEGMSIKGNKPYMAVINILVNIK